MSDSNEIFYGGTDPNVGAKKHKMTVIPKDQQLGQESNQSKDDITKSDMFLKLFGADAAKSFQKLEAKKEMEKPRIRTIKEAQPKEPVDHQSSGSKS